MDRSSVILFDIIMAERALVEMPANQERRRLARLAAEVARCCRASFGDRLIAALRRPASAIRNTVR